MAFWCFLTSCELGPEDRFIFRPLEFSRLCFYSIFCDGRRFIISSFSFCVAYLSWYFWLASGSRKTLLIWCYWSNLGCLPSNFLFARFDSRPFFAFLLFIQRKSPICLMMVVCISFSSLKCTDWLPFFYFLPPKQLWRHHYRNIFLFCRKGSMKTQSLQWQRNGWTVKLDTVQNFFLFAYFWVVFLRQNFCRVNDHKNIPHWKIIHFILFCF